MAIIVRVPNSLNRPHMVVFKRWSRFYSRNSAGKYQLDVHELRSAFIASESVADRIRQFRVERIDAILQGNTPETLSGKSYVCIHMIPIAAYDPSFSFDIARVRESLLSIGRRGCNPSVNFDGQLFSATVRTGEAVAYVQLFRNGVIEAVDCVEPVGPYQQRIDKYLPSVAYERDIIDSVSDYTRFYRTHEMPTPVLVGLALLNVKGFRMGKDGTYHTGRPIDRDHLILPDQFAGSLDFDAASFLRPCFDQIWNACGYDRSMNYNEKETGDDLGLVAVAAAGGPCRPSASIYRGSRATVTGRGDLRAAEEPAAAERDDAVGPHQVNRRMQVLADALGLEGVSSHSGRRGLGVGAGPPRRLDHRRAGRRRPARRRDGRPLRLGRRSRGRHRRQALRGRRTLNQNRPDRSPVGRHRSRTGRRAAAWPGKREIRQQQCVARLEAGSVKGKTDERRHAQGR